MSNISSYTYEIIDFALETQLFHIILKYSQLPLYRSPRKGPVYSFDITVFSL